MGSLKKCSICLEDFEASLKMFPKAKTKDGLGTYCRKCNSNKTSEWKSNNKDREKLNRRKSALKAAYGISVDEYDSILKSQDGGCKLCNRTDTGSKRCNYFHVDHDHATGKVRGLLCNNCNRGIGYLGDSPERLVKAAEYIRSHYVGKN